MDGNKYERELIRIYLRAETEIINEIARLRSLGLADYHVVAALRRVQRILSGLQSEVWKYTPKMVESYFYVNHPELRAMRTTAESAMGAYMSALSLTTEQTDVAGRLVLAMLSELQEAENRVMTTLENYLVGRRDRDVFRRTGLEQAARSEARGRFHRDLDEFVKALQREGVTAFVDKAGRHWRLHTYAGMVTRTTARQAEVLSVLTADPDHDLYIIRGADDPCGLCAPYQNRVYSKSGNDSRFPPLADAFGKVDPTGPNTLTNTWLNIHPNCRCAIVPWTEAGKSKAEMDKIIRFSSPAANPYDVDPRSKKAIEAYRRREAARERWLADYRQWQRYRVTVPDSTPKTFQTFLRHKRAGDEKYKAWERAYRWENKRLSFQPVIGQRTATGIEITGISRHAVDRAVSRGVTGKSALDALQNPVAIGKIRIDDHGQQSQQIFGRSAAVVVNPETGNIISCWRRSP